MVVTIKDRCDMIRSRKDANDRIYTPKPLALKLIEMCELKEGDTVLDPSFGAGVFYDNFPNYVSKEFCEIDMDKDFFNHTERVDCIVGNPPFSLWTKWLKHTMTITDKFGYIFGMCNITDTRIRNIIGMGYGITKIHLCVVKHWFGNTALVVFEKNKPSIMSVADSVILCDICNSKKCLRGVKGNPYNKCTIIEST